MIKPKEEHLNISSLSETRLLLEQALVDGYFHRVVLGIEQHGRTEAVLTLLALQDRVVDAALAADPKLVVVGQLRIGDGPVAQLGVDLHHRQTGRQAEQFRARELLQRQEERLGLDRFRKPQLAELRIDDQTRVGHIPAVSPRLDVAEPGPGLVLVESDYGLPLAHLARHVIGRALGNTRTARLSRLGHFVADSLSEAGVLLRGYQNIKIIDCHFTS